MVIVIGVIRSGAARGRVTARIAATFAVPADDAQRRATAFAVTVICVFLVVKVSWAAVVAGAGQVPFILALFVLPLLCAFPGGRRLLTRHRWPALAVQAVLTWVPFAVFGGQWVVGLGGLLAGMVLLLLAAPVSWLLAALLLVADVVVRAAVTGLGAPVWSGVVWALVTFVDDGLAFFGVVRLAQVVGEVEDARRRSAELAVARERLRAAREAAARARSMMADQQSRPVPEPAAGTSIGSRLAWAVLLLLVLGYTVQSVNNVVVNDEGPRLGSLLVAASAAIAALQVRHSWAARQGRRPRAWPLTLGLQALLTYVFFLPPLAGQMTSGAFLAGSLLLLIPGRRRWAAFWAMVISWSALYATVPLQGETAADRSAFAVLYVTALMVVTGLIVYGVSRLAGLARELAELQGELTRTAAVRERLRVARDVHDLLGLGLSAIALKSDLIGALISRDGARAAAELGELGRICAAAQADIRLVTGAGARLSLAAEVAAAERILTSAGIEMTTGMPDQPLPAVADEVLAPVLREAVTNVLRHATATACAIEVTSHGAALRLRVSNDGVTGREDGSRLAAGGGRGLANLTARGPCSLPGRDARGAAVLPGSGRPAAGVAFGGAAQQHGAFGDVATPSPPLAPTCLPLNRRRRCG